MGTSVKLQPGQRGTKRWLELYGEQLFCVRYRYDREHHKRYTTVELIVAEADWIPKMPTNTIVGVRIAWGEIDLARQVRAAGGTWNRARSLWELSYGQTMALHLLDRLVWLDV